MAYKPSLNDCKFIGRLGSDPELKYTNTQQPVMNFSIAVDESYKDKAGTWQERTTWIDVVVWGKRAEALNSFMHKGALVFVSGRLTKRTWDGKNGKVYVTEIVVNSQAHDVILLRSAGDGGRNEGLGGAPGPPQSPAPGEPATQQHLPMDGKKAGGTDGANIVSDDELPF